MAKLATHIAPVIRPVSDIVAEATDKTGAFVSYAPPTTMDDFDGLGVATCLPAPNSSFTLGVTTVICTATDKTGNVSSSSFKVTVRDTTPPRPAIPGRDTRRAGKTREQTGATLL